MPKDTVDDEVDRTVYGDKEVIGLGEGMIQGTKMLKQKINYWLKQLKNLRELSQPQERFAVKFKRD